MLAIKLAHISKSFLIPASRQDSLRENFINLRWCSTSKLLLALKDINLEVKAGEWLGMIGANGSGKSTLLKIISGIYEPDYGQVQVNGHLVPFLELGVGFNLDLSAQDNIFLNGVILGMSREKIREKFNTIVDFAGIRPFLQQKLKNFSSGMQIRLAFSIAIQAPGNIYLLDEVLAVGDYQFRQKCQRVFKKMRQQGKTVILVSHDLESIVELCDRCLWLRQSRIARLGQPHIVIEEYKRKSG